MSNEKKKKKPDSSGSMLDPASEKALNDAFHFAREHQHEYLTVEHLLLALLNNPPARDALCSCAINLALLRDELMKFLKATSTLFNDSSKDTQPTMALQRVLQRAVFQVQSVGKNIVTGVHLLVALFSEQDSQALHLLHQQKMTRLDLVNYIAHGITKNNSTLPDDPDKNYMALPEKDDFEMLDLEQVGVPLGKTPLTAFAESLNDKVRKRGDIFIGREEEIDRMVQILARRSKNNPILVGEPGVGKTALVEGLAQRINTKKVPVELQNFEIFSLDLAGMLAGTRYRGDFEQRMKTLMKELKKKPHVVLFIDEIHMLLGAGGSSNSASDAAEMMKPMLSRGEIKCIGATTHKEYRQIFEKEAALARRFQKVNVREPTVEETYEILKGLKPLFEKHHRILYSNAALKAASELSARYMTDRFLPDKAIDLLDEAGAYVKLIPEERRPKEVGTLEIENVLAMLAHIPAKSISLSDKETLRALDHNLKMLVFGQDEAIDALTATIKLARAGLRDLNKPWGCFLMAGPTGVGKTEVSQQLANLLSIKLARFDMSEYMEAHSVARLIGAPPGYVGYQQGGLLTEAILKNPYSVVLLDEIEKAHPDLFNVLLQVMDNGFLTDNSGRKVDFRNTILILTTNAGAFEGGKNTIGFLDQNKQSNVMEVLHRTFSPEFRNRLDAIIQFAPLSYETISKVVEKFLAQLQGQLNEVGVVMEVSEEAKTWLGEKGYDPKMGARPMARIIQEHLKKPLAEEILFGQLSEGGGTVNIDVNEEKTGIAFTYDPVQISHPRYTAHKTA